MKKVRFMIDGRSVMRAHDAAYVRDDEDARDELVRAAIDTISTDVEITVSGTTMHLAAWMDPEHWESDWEGAGANPDDLIAAAVEKDD